MKEYTIEWKAELYSESTIEAENRSDAIQKAEKKRKEERAIDERAINWKIDRVLEKETKCVYD